MSGRSGWSSRRYSSDWRDEQMEIALDIYKTRYAGMSRKQAIACIASDMDRHPRTVQRYFSAAVEKGILPRLRPGRQGRQTSQPATPSAVVGPQSQYEEAV